MYSFMIGDNDGFGFGIGDGGFVPTFLFDNRSPGEAAETDGSQFSDVTTGTGSPGIGVFPSFSIDVGSEISEATFTMDVSGVEESGFFAIEFAFNEISQGTIASYSGLTGQTGSVVVSITLDATEIAAINNTGYFDFAAFGSGDALAFDYFLLEVVYANRAPLAVDDIATVFEDGTTQNLWTELLSNDTDPDGNPLTILSIDDTATVGTILFDAATQSVRYAAGADELDALMPGDSFVTDFDYTVGDGFGGVATATVEITVFGIDEPNNGGNQNGGGGDDVLQGNEMANSLRGGAGNDTLIGGGGNDTMNGGADADYFIFGPGFGQDEISGFELGIDALDAADALGLANAAEVFAYFDTNGNGVVDRHDDESSVSRGRLTLEFDGDHVDGNADDSVTLKSITSLTIADFGDAFA